MYRNHLKARSHHGFDQHVRLGRLTAALYAFERDEHTSSFRCYVYRLKSSWRLLPSEGDVALRLTPGTARRYRVLGRQHVLQSADVRSLR